MHDREKIINAIEKAKKQSEEYAQDCIIVPFKEADMILALLKKQEATEQCLKTKCIICPHCDNCDVDDNGLVKEQEAAPIIRREIAHMLVSCCGSCGVAITNGDKFCRMCGKQVKWE